MLREECRDMEFRTYRLQIVYVVTEATVLAISLLHFLVAFKLELGVPTFIAALVVGGCLGAFASLRTWPWIEALIWQNRILTKWEFIKLGSWYFILLILVHLLILPIWSHETLVTLWIFFDGLLNGVGVTYFLILSLKVVLSERKLGQKIVVSVEVG